MSAIISIFKGLSAINSLIDKFVNAWVKFDVARIKDNYDEKEKEEVEILEAIDRAGERGDNEAIKHLMRQRAMLKRE